MEAAGATGAADELADDAADEQPLHMLSDIIAFSLLISDDRRCVDLWKSRNITYKQQEQQGDKNEGLSGGPALS